MRKKKQSALKSGIFFKKSIDWQSRKNSILKFLVKAGIFQLMILTSLFGKTADTLSIGDLAPDFTLLSHDKKKISLKDYRGKRVVVYFFPKAFSEYGKADITVFGISYDSPSALMAFKKKYNLPFVLLSDHKKQVAQAFGTNSKFWAKRITFVIDKEGRIEKIYNKVNVNTHAGEILDDILGKK
jgi:peroxiredoxin Q/BCP